MLVTKLFRLWAAKNLCLAELEIDCHCGGLFVCLNAYCLQIIMLLHDISITEYLSEYVKLTYSIVFLIDIVYAFIFHYIQCVPQKRKPINQVNFSENWNDLSEKVYIVTKFSLSSFFWHQLQDVLAMHDQARTISNDDVRIVLRRIGI